MNPSHFPGLAVPFTLSMLLAACGPLPIHTSFDTLTNETSKRSSEFLTYSTFVSLSGIVPQHGTQLLFHQPDLTDNKPSSPSFAVGISPTRSFVTERKFAMTTGKTKDAAANLAENAKAVRDIRDGLEQARLHSVGLAAVRTRLGAAQSLATRIGATKAGDEDAKQMKALLGDSVIGDDGKVVKAEVDKAVASIQKEEKELEVSVSKALAAAKSRAAQSNVVITRWAQEKRSKLSAFLSEAFAFSGQGHEVKSGTLIFGDFRVVSLYTGDDLLDMLRSSPQSVKAQIDNVGITTFSVKARHMAYIADMDIEKAVALRLNLTQEQLANLSTTFSNLNADVSASYGVSTDVSNSANISDSKVSIATRCFFPPAFFNRAIRDEILDSDGYQDLYAVRVQVKGQVLGLANHTRTAFSRIASACKPNNGMLDFKPGKGCDTTALKEWVKTCQVSDESAAASVKGAAPQEAKALSDPELQALFHNVSYFMPPE